MSLVHQVLHTFGRTSAAATFILFGVALSACGGGSNGGSGESGPVGAPSPTPQTTYTIGGSISGLTGSGLVLQNNGGDNLSASASGTSSIFDFSFATPIATGGNYAVTIIAQPVGETCSVANGVGSVAAVNVSNIAVTCSPNGNATNKYTIGGAISGLTSAALVLQDNGGDNLTIAVGATSFTFATSIAVGSAYAVTILSQPSGQTCTLANGSGTVAAANVTNITLTCSAKVATYTIGGTIGGPTLINNLVLQDNGGDNLSVAIGSTNFAFKTALASGASYAVTISAQPSSMNCTVANGAGTVGTANIANVAVTCAQEYTVGGTLSGLNGSGLEVQINGSTKLNNPSNGSFSFLGYYLATGAAYSVTVKTQPTSPAQFCTVMNNAGTIGSADVSNVAVNCANIGQFVYVANSTDTAEGDVSAFTVNPNTGALTPIPGGNVVAHTKPSGIVINPHQFSPAIFVSNATSADISEFDFALVSGNGFTAGAPITPPFGTSVVNETPAAIAISPSGAFLFTAGFGTGPKGAIYGFALDQNGNPPLDLPSAPVLADGPALGVTFDPTSKLLFATTSAANLLDVFSIASDSTLTAVANSPYPTGRDPRGVVVWPKSNANAGFVYTANSADSTISAFVYDGTPGDLQGATNYATGQVPMGIAIDPTGTYLYTANSGDGTVSAFTINQSTGALTSLGAAVASGNLNPTVHSNPGPVDVKVDPSGLFLYCVNGTDGSISEFTVSGGALSLSATYATGAGATSVAIY